MNMFWIKAVHVQHNKSKTKTPGFFSKDIWIFSEMNLENPSSEYLSLYSYYIHYFSSWLLLLVCLFFSCGSIRLFFAICSSPQSNLCFPPWSSFYGTSLQSSLSYWMLNTYAPIPKKQESLPRWCLLSWSSPALLLWTGTPKETSQSQPIPSPIWRLYKVPSPMSRKVGPL